MAVPFDELSDPGAALLIEKADAPASTLRLSPSFDGVTPLAEAARILTELGDPEAGEVSALLARATAQEPAAG